METEEIDKVAFKFFKLFSEYECRLKNNGYLKDAAIAQPNWYDFIKQFEYDLSNLPSYEFDCAEYILNNPPMKQIVNEGCLDWQDTVICERDSKSLLKCIKTVRNNLFHGAKLCGTWSNKDRDYKLINFSFIILKYFDNEFPS